MYFPKKVFGYSRFHPKNSIFLKMSNLLVFLSDSALYFLE